MQKIICQQILKVLTEYSYRYVSVQELSDQLGYSERTILHHLNVLMEQGYPVEGCKEHGYQLTPDDKLTPKKIKRYLQTSSFGRAIRYFQSIPTTQTFAHQWAKEGAKEGSIVIAEEQTAGKGRLGKQWLSPSSQGIWMSCILRPSILLHEASQITLLTSLAINRAIWTYTKLPVQIKWPNDLLIYGRKVCGILTEIKGKQDAIDYVVVGVGINVNPSHEFEQIDQPNTSLSAAWGRRIERAELLGTILNVWEQWYQVYQKEGFQPIKQKWESLTQLVGQRITANTPTGKVIGMVEGINSLGALVLQTESGRREIYSAEVEYESYSFQNKDFQV